jgi:hypothetical protein
LHIIDVSIPSAPVEVGLFSTPGLAFGVAVSENYAYVADFDAGLHIIDVSHPPSPIEIGYYDTPGYSDGVAVAGNYIYLTDGIGGLFILAYIPPLCVYLPLAQRNP